MTNRDLIRIVLANLNRMKLRASLTAVGVLVGTTAIVTHNPEVSEYADRILTLRDGVITTDKERT